MFDELLVSVSVLLLAQEDQVDGEGLDTPAGRHREE